MLTDERKVLLIILKTASIDVPPIASCQTAPDVIAGSKAGTYYLKKDDKAKVKARRTHPLTNVKPHMGETEAAVSHFVSIVMNQ